MATLNDKNRQNSETSAAIKRLLAQRQLTSDNVRDTESPPQATSSPRSTLSTHFKIRRKQWTRAPWYVRSGIEGLALIFVISIVVALAPRIKHHMDQTLHRRLDTFNLTEISPTLPTERDDTPITQDSDAPLEDSELDETGDQQNAETTPPIETTKVGPSEIWRFYIKTDTPDELRTGVAKILAEYESSIQLESKEGVQAPGGIQFSFIAPMDLVQQLSDKLRNIPSPETTTEADQTGRDQTSKSQFTWYKSKAKVPIPAGKTRIVIWLSQF